MSFNDLTTSTILPLSEATIGTANAKRKMVVPKPTITPTVINDEAASLLSEMALLKTLSRASLKDSKRAVASSNAEFICADCCASLLKSAVPSTIERLTLNAV